MSFVKCGLPGLVILFEGVATRLLSNRALLEGIKHSIVLLGSSF